MSSRQTSQSPRFPAKTNPYFSAMRFVARCSGAHSMTADFPSDRAHAVSISVSREAQPFPQKLRSRTQPISRLFSS